MGCKRPRENDEEQKRVSEPEGKTEKGEQQVGRVMKKR